MFMVISWDIVIAHVPSPKMELYPSHALFKEKHDDQPNLLVGGTVVYFLTPKWACRFVVF